MAAPVWLVGSHHNFYTGCMFSTLDEMPEAKELGWKPLLPEYLRRRVASSSGKLVDAQWNAVYMAAFRALRQLDGFVSAVSFRVLEGDKDRMQFSKRVWCQIYLASSNKCVVNFSHDTRYSNSPFSSLLQWLEDPQFDNNDEVRSEQLLQYSDVDFWHNFFLGRIQKELDDQEGKVIELSVKQDNTSDHARELKSALSCLATG